MKKVIPFPHRKLISLWDMISFPASRFICNLFQIDEEAGLSANQLGKGEISIGREQKTRLEKLLSELEKDCQTFQLTSSLSHVSQTRFKLGRSKNYSHQVLFDNLRNILSSIHSETENLKFVYIEAKKERFFEHEKLFDDAVYNAFISAREDVKNAGNCMAANLNTGAIFHMMRVMEFGLRLLHKKLVRVKPHDPNWSTLLREIDKKIDERDKLNPKPSLWRKQRGFYVECARHFFFFKDKRNHSVHVEFPLDEYVSPSDEQTERTFNEVKSFMQHLATKLKDH